ncbi:4'-phosphopantetheinyl transferase family protein [Paenibacillus sp. NPDC057934]|uniref:4'-phosphopantetheinyl transferase family protein n=1 Tax=Paenibacillus sp. NPDC057934 TaxID=3346282 RepID=UPI0036D8541D
MSQIVVLEIPGKLDSNTYEFWKSKVSVQRRNGIGRFLRLEDAYRSLFGEILVRTLIRQERGIPNQEIHFQKNEYGKPHLEGEESFSFNVSHSGKWVSLIYGTGRLGVDIEEIRPIDLTIAERFFSDEEYEDLMLRPEEARTDYFYEIWTLKEAYVKALGSGLSHPLTSFSVRKHPDGSARLSPDAGTYYFKTYDINSAYKFSACSSQEDLPDQFVLQDIQKLQQFWLND